MTHCLEWQRRKENHQANRSVMQVMESVGVKVYQIQFLSEDFGML